MSKKGAAVDYRKYAKSREEITNHVLAHMGFTHEAFEMIRRLYTYDPARVGRYTVMMSEDEDDSDEELMEYEEFWSMIEGGSFYRHWDEVAECNYWTDVMEEYGVREVLLELADEINANGYSKE